MTTHLSHFEDHGPATNHPAEVHIETERQPVCVVCGKGGKIKYRDLPDRLFGAPGLWSIRECEDPNCGTLWLDPRPTPGDIGKAYCSYDAHVQANPESFIKRAVRFLARERAAARYGYSTSRLPWPGMHLASAAASAYPGLGEHLDLMIRYLTAPRKDANRLLDVGCGDGEAMDILRDLGWQVVGVEPDTDAVTSATRRGLDVRHGNLVTADFPSDSFDAVTSSHVIEHVHGPQAFLAESLRILKAGGRLVTVTPNSAGWSHLRHSSNWLALDPPRHLFVCSAYALRAMAEAAGFRNVKVWTTARAVALTEIASSRTRDEGSYRWGSWPGWLDWLRAQRIQYFATSAVKKGRFQGDELVLVAEK